MKNTLKRNKCSFFGFSDNLSVVTKIAYFHLVIGSVCLLTTWNTLKKGWWMRSTGAFRNTRTRKQMSKASSPTSQRQALFWYRLSMCLWGSLAKLLSTCKRYSQFKGHFKAVHTHLLNKQWWNTTRKGCIKILVLKASDRTRVWKVLGPWPWWNQL